MSSWTDKEVAELERKGNDYARRTWLKNAPPIGQGGRPKEGDHIDVFKRFVVDVYERKRYYDEDEAEIGATSGYQTHVATAVSAPRADAGKGRVATRAPVRKAVLNAAPPPSAPSVDLLDFGSMSLATPPSEATNNGNSSKAFETNFDAFAPVPSVTTSEPSTDIRKAGATSKKDVSNSFDSQTLATVKDSSKTFEANFDAFAPVTSVSTSEPSTRAKMAAARPRTDPFNSFNSHAVVASKDACNTSKANFDAFAPVLSEPISQPSTISKTVAARTKVDPLNSLSSSPTDAFQANFDAFSPAFPVSTTSRSSNGAKSAGANAEHDPFQPSIKQTSDPSNSSSFDFINSNNTIATPSPVPPPMKKPIMNNPNSSQNSNLISSMSMPAPNHFMQQGSDNMKMRWNTNNNPNYHGRMGNMQSPQNQTMMQQQRMNMMNGMYMNNNGMGGGMMNTNNAMMMMGGTNNPMMINQQQTMMNGNNFGRMMSNTNGKSNSAMQSLQLNSSSMSAWSSGLNK
eukprot:CAMPEP_0197175410 /NCGR_PEP_ID=MMETSP1423-20130617/1635_1 /TAXON_ID=476441 /ORGANISM="Pseudo-nitzschia heimii, Strain UNC1101" /LENGTH=512 /DNA_ID=CAMNT_0042624571 /DNA_START=312 /DNA_END=1850 /DNA_ORIENTATION=+